MVTSPGAILIDLDGTLCDTDASVQAGVNGACVEARRLLGVDEQAWRAANDEAARIEWTANAQRWTDGKLSPLDLSVQIYARTLTAVGADPALALDFVNAHAAAASLGLHPYTDVRPFLDAVHGASIKLALVTNGASETQRKTIETLGLAEYFDAVVISSEHSVSKPDSAIFTIALGELGGEAGSAWHIGDSLESDVAGALGAGLGAVWINRQGKEPRTDQPLPSIEISLLTDLIGRLPDHSRARRN